MPRAFSMSIQSETVLLRPGLAVDRPGLLDDAGVQRERLGERALAGVGVADDRERAAARGLAAAPAAGPPPAGVFSAVVVTVPGYASRVLRAARRRAADRARSWSSSTATPARA